MRRIRGGIPALARANLLLTLGFSVLILYPLLEENTREHDRRRIEALAQDVLRPVDSWFSLVVQDALRSFSSEETASVLVAGDSTEIQRLALTRWAQSWACREGYTSIFTLFDAQGNALSRFAIGGQVGQAGEVDTALFHDNVMEVTERDIGRGINALKVYAGITDIRSEGGRVLGIGRVTVAAGQQTLFRGETPQIMRGATKANLQSFYRPVVVSEFRDGKPLPSGTGVFPIGYSLPEPVAGAPHSPLPAFIWADETLESGSYETLFIRREGNGNETIGLSLRKPGLSDYLIGIVKVLIHFALLAAVVLAAFLAVDLVKGRRYLMTFRGRLLLALIVTAVIPLALLSFYLRFDARERLLEESARTLDEQTGEVAGYFSDEGRGVGAASGGNCRRREYRLQPVSRQPAHRHKQARVVRCRHPGPANERQRLRVSNPPGEPVPPGDGKYRRVPVCGRLPSARRQQRHNDGSNLRAGSVPPVPAGGGCGAAQCVCLRRLRPGPSGLARHRHHPGQSDRRTAPAAEGGYDPGGAGRPRRFRPCSGGQMEN